jgi:hypothetical protein
MKKNIVITAFIFGMIHLAQAQEKKHVTIPEAVAKSFTNLKPSAKAVEWEMEGKDYEAEFKENGVESSMIFDATGKHLMTETEIEVSALPKAIIDDLKTRANGKKIKEASRLEYTEGKTLYEAECGDVDYIFDAKGKFIEIEKDEDGDKDDENDDDKKH